MMNSESCHSTADATRSISRITCTGTYLSSICPVTSSPCLLTNEMPDVGLPSSDSNGMRMSDMFSTTPSTLRPVFLQKFSSFRTSAMDTSCGVVITTAPSMAVAFRYCTMEMCSSDVPGGVSMIR